MLSGGRVAHTTPEKGKSVESLDEFLDGKPFYGIERPILTPQQKQVVEQIALADLGRPYDALTANCEHDVTKAQTGIPQSPTVDFLSFVGGLFFLLKAVEFHSDASRTRPRKRIQGRKRLRPDSKTL